MAADIDASSAAGTGQELPPAAPHVPPPDDTGTYRTCVRAGPHVACRALDGLATLVGRAAGTRGPAGTSFRGEPPRSTRSNSRRPWTRGPTSERRRTESVAADQTGRTLTRTSRAALRRVSTTSGLTSTSVTSGPASASQATRRRQSA